MEQDTLFYFSKSANKDAGRGKNEFVLRPEDYSELNTIKDWRKILSNFYVAPFVFQGKRWNTVEHAFQSAKIGMVDETKADWFSLNSGHLIGCGDGLIARRNRKLVMLDGETLKIWDEIKSEIMGNILYAKFSQVDLAKKVLLATNHSILLHGTRGLQPQRQFELEQVRDRLR